MQKELRITFEEFHDIAELKEEWQVLLRTARTISGKAWSPYSGFCVGAAVRLADGTVITGNNQENAAYPSGLCAERTALFYANANFPELAVETIAISAKNKKGLVSEPVKPCGSCRQVMLETETRFNQPITIVLDGKNSIYVLKGIDTLLPLNFKPESLKG